MAELNDVQLSIAERIADGSIEIESIREFRRLLKALPDHPDLHAVFSDLLARKNSREAAADFYGKAVGMYIEAGRMLPAIVYKALEWQIREPSSDGARRFFDDLRLGDFPESPVHRFLERLSLQELTDLMRIMERLHFDGGVRLRKIGDAEDALNFILRGTLRSTTHEAPAGNRGKSRKRSRMLAENDFFGDIYPFNTEKVSQAQVETVDRVQIIRLSRPHLNRLCRSQPRLELALIDLYNTRRMNEDDEFLRMVRRTDRRQLPIRMKLKIFPPSTAVRSMSGVGYSRDVSVGGACVVLDKRFMKTRLVRDQIKNARIEVSLPSEAMTMNVRGTIVWHRDVTLKGEKTIALGIQFDEMSPQLRGMLVAFADILSIKGQAAGVPADGKQLSHV
jgi:hypothetical protein